MYRAFLTKSYPTMKKHNPNIPIMLREAAGTSPKVYARYEFGQEKSQSLEGTNARMHRDLYRYPMYQGKEAEHRLSTYLKKNHRELTTFFFSLAIGLSDKQIEDTVTGLVQQQSA